VNSAQYVTYGTLFVIHHNDLAAARCCTQQSVHEYTRHYECRTLRGTLELLYWKSDYSILVFHNFFVFCAGAARVRRRVSGARQCSCTYQAVYCWML